MIVQNACTFKQEQTVGILFWIMITFVFPTVLTHIELWEKIRDHYVFNKSAYLIVVLLEEGYAEQ